MYERRFEEPVAPELTLQQLRGLEGIRVRETYARVSRETGVPWSGRSYRVGSHGRSDIVNRALSTANSCLYGVCHAAIVAAGYSPARGFIHTGKMLSFVFDVADLYKTEVSIPAAFMAAADGPAELDAKVRRYCRNQFRESRLLTQVVADIDDVLATGAHQPDLELDASEEERPGRLWDVQGGEVAGGTNYASDELMRLAGEVTHRVEQTAADKRASDAASEGKRPARAAGRRRVSGGGR